LLQAASGLRHEEIVAEPDLILSADVTARFWSLVERRSAFEPVSRIMGTREFYGRSFRVTPDVLDPRADTETLIGAALALAKDKRPPRILDLGTGSGAIVVTLLAELLGATAVASDLSVAALQVAKGNAEVLGVANRASFVQANWFDGVDGQFDLIVSNPPYIPLGDIAGLAIDVRDFDPPKALDGGPDGLEAYRRTARGAGGHLAPKGHIILEIGAGQENAVNDLFKGRGFVRESRHFDLAGHVRCLAFNRP
jgi:release factor glutamine methyltransferase